MILSLHGRRSVFLLAATTLVIGVFLYPAVAASLPPAASEGVLAAHGEKAILFASADTYVDGDLPNQSNCDTPILAVGPLGERRVLLQFDLSSLPSDAVIREARLQLRRAGQGPSFCGTVQVYAVLRDWDCPQANWLQATGTLKWSRAGVDATPDDRRAQPEDSFSTGYIGPWYEADLTQLAKEWQAGTVPNHGIVLLTTEKGSRFDFALHSSESTEEYQPRLVISYERSGQDGTPTRTSSPTLTTSPTATPTSSPTPTTLSTATSTATATRTATTVFSFNGSPLVFSNTALPAEPIPATWDIHYTFLITNISDSVVTNVVVTDVKDRNTYYHESLPHYSNRVDENTFIWNVGSLQPGERYTILFIVSTGPSVAGRVMVNTATVDSAQSDPITKVCYTLMGPIPQTPYPGVTYTPTRVSTSSPTATPTLTPTPTVIPGGGAAIRLAPAQRTVLAGQTFDEQIVVEAGALQVAAADVFLDVDPQQLEVVSISDGSQLEILFKQADPATGHISIGAGTLGPAVAGTFELATLHLRARQTAQLGTTNLTFSVAGVRRTVLKDELDHNLLGQAYGAAVDVVSSALFRVFLPIMVR